MNRFQAAISTIFGSTSAPVEQRTKKRPTGLIDTTVPVDRIKMEMKTLVNAAEAAVYPANPDRRDLIGIYERASKDAHVISQFQIAESKLVGEQFIVSRAGSDDQELTAMFKKPWFEDFIKLCFEAEMWGYTLVEFGPIINGNWANVTAFPRRHVQPFSRNILIRPGDRQGIPYYDKPEALFLIELGKPKDLGRLEIISREVIWKNFSRTDWSQASEKFGMPLLNLKTDADDTELDRMEEMCRNFASNGWIITRTEDSVEFLETAKSDIHKIYMENAKFCDEQISKCVNGQTSTSDEKAYSGSAQVHEGILEDFHAARLRHASNIVNYTLFPFLIYHGYNLENCSFRFPALDVREQSSQGTDPDPDSGPNTDPLIKNPAGSGGAAGLKKKSSQASLKFPGWVIAMPEE